MLVNVCGARSDDFGEYPGFRGPNLAARRSRDCVHLVQIWACGASTFRDKACVCGLGHVDPYCFLRRTVAVPRRVWGARWHDASRYSAFLENTVMSGLFVRMSLPGIHGGKAFQ